MLQEKYAKEIEEIIYFSKLAYDRQLVTASGGNVSMRCAEGILVTSTGVSLRDVKPEDILLVSPEGEILENPKGLRPSKETTFHLSIYRARPGVNAVYHVHPPYTVAYTVANVPFPRVTSSAKNKLCQAITLEPMKSGSPELAKAVQEAIEGADEKMKALILRLHGIVSFDSSMEEAFNTAELMEDCARIAYRSEQILAARK